MSPSHIADCRVRLHHGVRLVGRRIGLVELDRRSRESASEVSDGCLSGASIWTLLGKRRRPLMGLEIERSVAPDIIYTDEGGGRPCLFERFGDDQGRDLMVVVDFRAGQKPLNIELTFASGPAFSWVTTAMTPGAAFARRIDGLDRPLEIAAPTT